MISNIAFVLILIVAAIYVYILLKAAANAPIIEDQPTAPQAQEPAHDHLPVRPHHPGHAHLRASPPRPGDQRPPGPTASPSPTPTRISPHLIQRAQAILTRAGYTVSRIKNGSASITVPDPDDVVAWNVSRGNRPTIKRLTTRELIELAIEAAGERPA